MSENVKKIVEKFEKEVNGISTSYLSDVTKIFSKSLFKPNLEVWDYTFNRD